MPELPEVETIKNGLNKKILGRLIKNVEINKPQIIKFPLVGEFVKKIRNKVFRKIIRRGKYLIFELGANSYLVIHLKMTGQLIYGAKEEKNRVVFVLDNGKFLNFNDTRIFGGIYLVDKWQELKGIAKLGIEPLEKKFTVDLFEKMIKEKKTKIKALLMDQTFIAGLGNIYAQESLFKANIHPERIAKTLNKTEIKNLYLSIKEILSLAIKNRGSSIDTFVDEEGNKGKMAEQLRVYGRSKKPCLRCNTLIKAIKMQGRGTSFCPKCQK